MLLGAVPPPPRHAEAVSEGRSDHLTVQGSALYTQLSVAYATGHLLLLTGAHTALLIAKVLFHTASP